MEMLTSVDGAKSLLKNRGEAVYALQDCMMRACGMQRVGGLSLQALGLHNISYATFVPGALPLGLGALSWFGCSVSPPPASAATPPEPAWGYLDNGMAYILLESHAAPLIGSSVIVHSGSAREEMSTSGASHFLEHLLFNGTTTRTQEQLYDEVDAIGGYNNATTRKTHVAYMMVTPAEKIRTGLEIQADMLFHSIIDSSKVEKERGIILAEMAKDLDAGTFEQERHLDLASSGRRDRACPPSVASSRSRASVATRSPASIGATTPRKT